VTTMWDILHSKKVGEDRERELEKGNNFWARMIARGAKKFRHYGTRETAVDVVKGITTKSPIKLKIQKELSSEHASVAETKAGKYVADCLLKEKKLIEENPDSIRFSDNEETLGPQGLTERIDKDIEYMQIPVENLMAQAQEVGTKSEEGGATAADKVAEDNGAEKAPDGPPLRRPFLQKLFDMIRRMDLRATPT